MRIYSVTFFQYNNNRHNAVSREGGGCINVEVGPFLVTGEQISEISQYGGGIKDLIFVGELLDVSEVFTANR